VLIKLHIKIQSYDIFISKLSIERNHSSKQLTLRIHKLRRKVCDI